MNAIHDYHLKNFAAKYCHGRLIDIGCGSKPYQRLLAPYVSEHIGVDHEGTLHEKSNIDLFGSAYSIPAEDESFDSALCTAVLEHLEEPEKALGECFRVLKKGGYAIFSIPFIWHLHEEPRDFFRYSKYGIKYLFEKVGFEIIELKALSGFWVTFGQLFVYYLNRFHRGPLKLLPIIPILGIIIQATSFLLDKIDRCEQWTWMYMIVAKKA
ncbi:MAG: class I SAM-dependent methyltransferase [candidate division KSB1 bacterium]|nr:class I SAM-dependent methyltransferase [candidate division KSB1 bacterium]